MNHKPSKSEEIKRLKLVAAILIDLIGMLSYLLPGASELIDSIWAPISAFLVYFLFNRKLSWASFTFFEDLKLANKITDYYIKHLTHKKISLTT